MYGLCVYYQYNSNTNKSRQPACGILNLHHKRQGSKLAAVSCILQKSDPKIIKDLSISLIFKMFFVKIHRNFSQRFLRTSVIDKKRTLNLKYLSRL